MGILDIFKKKADAASTADTGSGVAGAEVNALNTDRLDQIVAYVREHYSKPVIRIQATRAENLPITESKFGGYPYWESGREIPRNGNNEPLFMIAQINFGRDRMDNPVIPQAGILQFFIADDDLYGMDFSDQTKQDSFRVVYHPEVDDTVTVDDVIASGMVTTTQAGAGETLLPFTGEYRLSFEAGMDSVGYCAEDEFDEAIAAALKALFDQEMDGSVFNHFSKEEFDYLAEKLCVWGHKMLGYPNFTQYDPRDSEADKCLDTLLFQMDSDCKDIIWGDTGVANFFINEGDLRTLDFSRVMYNWDCY